MLRTHPAGEVGGAGPRPHCEPGPVYLKKIGTTDWFMEDMKRTSKGISKRQQINGPDILAPRKPVCMCVSHTHTHAHTLLADLVHTRTHTCSQTPIFKCIDIWLDTIYTRTHKCIRSGLISLLWVCTQAHKRLLDPGHAYPRKQTGTLPRVDALVRYDTCDLLQAPV